MTRRDLPLILKFAHWPAADQEAWPGLFERAGLFDEEGRFAAWSAPTRRAAEERYGQWLSYLARCRPQDLAAPPAHRITQDAVRGFVEEAEGRVKPVTIMGWMTNLWMIAEAWEPDGDWGWLKRAARHWTRRGTEAGLKPPLPLSAAELLRWSLRRMEAVENMSARTSAERALHFRDALMVGCLIACPVRARAFAAITVDRHLRRTEAGYELQFEKSDMKDRRERVFALTPRLTNPLTRYLEEHRPALLKGQQCEHLWVKYSGRPLSKDGFACHLKNVTSQHLGVALRPHAFRHIAATSIAEYDPQHVGIIRDILGHATLRMAEKHYNRAVSVSACNALQEVLRNWRRRSTDRS